MSGADVLRQIRNGQRLAGVLVLVVTAFEEMLDEIREQADGVLIKPVSFDSLHKSVLRLWRERSESEVVV